MSYAANLTTPGQMQISPLVLSDRLLSLAEDADLAGLRSVGERLLGLALSVLDGPDAAEIAVASRRAGGIGRAPRRRMC